MNISHAFVLPDRDFQLWLPALDEYRKKFERVAVIRDPAGNDLNPYRHVTALAVPNVWMNNDPLLHIRRIYPQVVRVDVITVKTPQELKTALQARISANDRFGETLNNGEHLDERFTLAWASDYRPMRILKAFTSTPTGAATDNMGIDLASRAGSTVLAASAGTVVQVWGGQGAGDLGIGKYVQVRTQHNLDTYTITYAGLGNISILLNRIVAIGDKLGEAGGDSFKLIVQHPKGKAGYRLPTIIDPMPLIYVDDLRVRPTSSGLRMRTSANTDGDVLGTLDPIHQVMSKELHARTLAKIGVENEWLRIRTPDGKNAYVAAWFLEAVQASSNLISKLNVNPTGVNLDARHPVGKPPASRLGKLGWLRMGYNVSNYSGSEDIQAAYNVYAPLAEQYAKAGYKMIFVTSHQTYGEGKNEFWPWRDMTDAKWELLIAKKNEMMARIVKQWAGKGLVHAWQIWNEQDAHHGAEASVRIEPHNYAKMLNALVPTIRSIDKEMLVITGGHNSGAVGGSNYAKETIKRLNSNAIPDGVAFHPYGCGAKVMKYAPFGSIDESMREYSKVLPDKPLWITEWGVLDLPHEPASEINAYAMDMVTYLKSKYPEQLACLIWYAWSQGMHNGYGLVDAAENPRPPLTEQFLNA